MDKKIYIKKAISITLCIAMLSSVLPIKIFANPQKHVGITSIGIGVESNHPLYTVNIEWDNIAHNGGEGHNTEGFRIEGRNASKGGAFEIVKEEEKKGSSNTQIKTKKLDPGSIYEYRIVPYHKHKDDNNKEAPYDKNTKLETTLLMTDIRVDTKGYGNTLEITFDNPKYNGKDIFDGYKIYYARGGSSVTEFKEGTTIDIDNTDLIPSKDASTGVSRLTYKLTKEEDIRPGNIYAVKVEPVYKKKNIREKASNVVSIDDVLKKITYSPQDTKEYRTDDGHVAIPLYITEDDGKYIKLNWGDLSDLTLSAKIESIEIFSGDDPNSITTLLSTIYGHSIMSSTVIKPKKKTYYQIRVNFEDKDSKPIKPILSIIAMYDPGDVNLTPNKPMIYPKVNVTNNVSTLDVYWDTFTRVPYNEAEKDEVDGNGMYFDTNVYYDFYISDSAKVLEDIGIPKILDKVYANDIETTNIEEAKDKVFKKNIDKYYTMDETGKIIEKPIEENKMYYIKIVATKPTSDGIGLASEPSYKNIYVKAKGDISIPKSLSKPPFKIKKDKKGIDMITTTDMVVEWNTKWYEIYDKKTDKWYTNASVQNGAITFYDEIKDEKDIIKFYDMDTKETIKSAFKQAGYTDSDNLSIREVDLSSKNIKYEMIVETFDKINANGGYKKYIEELLVSADDRWKGIEPSITNEKYAEYTIKDLEENTRYVVLFRPYKMIDENKKEAYPSYLLATTLPKDVDIEITPVVPTLFEAGKTDTSVLVEWENPTDLYLYEIVADKTLLEKPDSAKIKISSEDIQKNSKNIKKNDIAYIQYNIEPLFPETGYYIWLRSIIKGTDKKSGWSNPIYVSTNKLKKPDAPSGFGLASQKSLDTYNAGNDTKYIPKSSDYIVLEWLKDANDYEKEPKADKKGTAEPLLDEKIKNTYMVKFNELIANRYYYTRAKTKLTITDTGKGIEKHYSYIISLSKNSDFTDDVEIEIPTVDGGDKDSISIESDWSNTLRFKTKPSTGPEGDFDGNIIDDLYPLPTEDFDIVYDDKTGTLTYKFRSNKVGANGSADNLVDQRFITNLINNKVFNYNIDLTHHFNRYIKTRRVELPYSIISTLDNMKTSLSITAGGTRLTLNPNFLNTKEVKSLGKMNSDTVVAINIEQSAINIPVIAYNEQYATSPQTISISVSNNGKYKDLTHTGSMLDIKQKVNSRALFLENNVSTYRNINNGKWENIPSIYDNETGIFSVKTNRLGSYTTIATSPHTNNINIGGDTNILAKVNEKIKFNDLKNADLSLPISVVQFNNIVSGIANNKKEININNALSTKDTKALSRSGMLLKGSIVRRDFGINALVKLYELKTKAKYEPTDTIHTTSYKDIKNANKVYQQNLLKAGELGFIQTDSAFPNDTLSMNDMLYMIDIILSDSGY